jgi:phosphoribosylpyrophosphate synthetase
MAAPAIPEREFIELWGNLKSAQKVADAIGVAVAMVHKRRRNIERMRGIKLESDDPSAAKWAHLQTAHQHPQRYDLGILNGTVIVFSDAHFWPGMRTTAFKGLLHLIRNMQPQAVVNNGDAFDGASISRFPRIGWDSTPTLIQELKACDASLGEIEEAAKKARHNVQLPWCSATTMPGSRTALRPTPRNTSRSTASA